MSLENPAVKIATQRFIPAKRKRRIHETPWDQNRKLFLPFHSPVNFRPLAGQDLEHRMPGIYDSTGVQAVEDAANFTKSMLFPPDFPWLRIKAKAPWDKDLRVKAILDDMALVALKYISDSNFYLAGNQWIKQWFVFGNTTIHTDELPPRLRTDGTTFTALDFTTVAANNSWWTIGRGNKTIYQFRADRMAAVDALYEFESTAEKGGQVIKDFMKNPGGEMEDFQVLHMIFRNDSRVKEHIDIGNARWGGAWLAMENGEQPTDLLRLETYDFNPYVNGRFDVPAGETYGHGPASRVAMKMKGLNNIERNTVKALVRDLNPTLAVGAKEFVHLEQVSGGIATIRMEPGAPNPFFLESGTRPEKVEPQRERMEMAVKMAFVGSVFDDPSDAEPRSAQRVVDKRANQVNRNSQPAEHVHRELIVPMADNTIRMLVTGGVFQRQLALLSQITRGSNIEVEYTSESPYFTAQKDTVVQRLRAHLQWRMELHRQDPEGGWIRDINASEAMKIDAELSAVPHRMFHTDDEVARIIEQEDAAAQAAETRAALESLGKAAPAMEAAQVA